MVSGGSSLYKVSQAKKLNHFKDLQLVETIDTPSPYSSHSVMISGSYVSTNDIAELRFA